MINYKMVDWFFTTSPKIKAGTLTILECQITVVVGVENDPYGFQLVGQPNIEFDATETYIQIKAIIEAQANAWVAANYPPVP